MKEYEDLERRIKTGELAVDFKTTPINTSNFEGYCQYLLPCGYCLATGTMCMKQQSQVTC